tara:strand:- start:1755 stop:11438 length:9684 start_codon:yes stop_codon:yes gene_type:complete
MEENQIIIQSVSPDTFEFQDYSTSDETLIVSNELDTVFSGSTDYIEAYVYDENQNQISSQVPFTNYSVTKGDVVLTPSNDLERLGFDVGSYYISYDFYRPQLGSTLNSQFYISEISSDRTEIRLDSTVISNELLISSSLEFIEYRDTSEYFVDFLLNFGNNQQIIANNIELDAEDLTNPTILIKLYEALPSEFDLKSLCFVVEQISTPQSYNVTFPPLEFTPDDFSYISGPNYNLNIKGQSGTPGMDFSYNTLVSSDLTSSFNQVNSLINRKEIEISVDYEDYNDFIYFSSAYTRLQNFYYKVGLIQSASAQLDQITSATTGSTVFSSSQAIFSSIISTTIDNFDGYEYFLYFNSGSQYSYPKSNTEPPYALYPTGSDEVLNWIGSTDGSSAYFGGQSVTASNYDENNSNSLYYAIPEYLRSDPQNAKYELFVDMVGQHYDNIWLYTKNITTKFNADNRLDYGIAKDMVADAIRDFGVKLYSNNFNTDDLYTAFLGLTPSGSTFPFPYMTGSIGGIVDTPSGYEYVDSTVSASNDIIPLDDVNKRLYKRIYHNIPYLLKTKGTIAGLRSLITSYGIPDTILRINEFGGKDRNNSQDWDLKQDFYNLGLNTTSVSITSSFALNSAFSSSNDTPITSRPGSIQFRFKTNGIPSGSETPTTQSFFLTDSTSKVAMAIEYNEDLLTTGEYSGSVESKYKEYGTLKFWPNADTNPTNYASLYLPFWDGDWWSVQVNRNISSVNPSNGTFTLLAANKIEENLGFTGSDEISADISQWGSSNKIHWIPNEYFPIDSIFYFPFTGSFQEIRYYAETISESVFFDYTMNPYSFEGNGTNTAPNQLAFRLPLGSLLGTGSDNTYVSGSYYSSIHPKVTGSWVTTSSFDTHSTASFTSQPTWLNNVEDLYFDQTPSGMRNRVTDKIQTEALILPEGDTLSGYRSIQQMSYVSESFTPNINYLEVAFSPQDQINDDIIGQMGYFNIGDYIGDPRLISSSDKSYPDLDLLRDAYFEKYITNYDVTDFVRLIKFFDNSLFKMIEDFTPARTSLSSGVVIKQHLLERNRQRPAQVSSSFEQYSGSVTNLPKNYSTGSSDYPQYDFSGSSIYVFKSGTGGSFEPFNGLQTYISGTLDNGPDNRYFLTQSWEEGWETFSGSAPILREDQREFYNGEFSGSNIEVGINDICSAFFKINPDLYTYVPIFFSANGNNNTQVLTAQQFLEPTRQPNTGEAWFWNDGSSVLYIKLSLETYNGINISEFITTVNEVTFAFNNPIDINGQLLTGVQTYQLESVGIQLGTNVTPEGVGTALCYTIPGESSTAISSQDANFYDFNFSASGDFQWHATQDTSTDPNPVQDTGISSSIPQAYFPITYHTESFFRGWASSNFYTNGTFNSFNGILSDPLNNFNTGSKEIDNTDTTPDSGIDPPNNVPWFMNAAPASDGEGSNWIQIPSESFLDYANIPDTTVGPVSSNNYFNIAWTSQSSAETRAIQGVNYYYNASNNAIYMSGSEFQNDIKFAEPLYSSSLVFKLSDTSQLASSATSYTPVDQTSLTIPIDPSRGQELWVYKGESNVNDLDTNAWRYNRYMHRPFKIYYVTETGSGSPSIPYSLYDPLDGIDSTQTLFNDDNSVGPVVLDDLTIPTYYNDGLTQFATMLGTQGDELNQPTYARVLNDTESFPSLDPVSGSFQVFSELRQVKPFLYTTYKNAPLTPGVNPARGSGSYVAISQSDGTPFALLRMYQNEQPTTNFPTGTAVKITCLSLAGCSVAYYDSNCDIQYFNLSYFDNDIKCGCEERQPTTSPYTGIVNSALSTGTIIVSENLDGDPNPCAARAPGGGGGANPPRTIRNNNPYFYTSNIPNSPGVLVGNFEGFEIYNIPYGEFFNGENTSSLSLTTGTQPGGLTENTEIVFPEGSYIFTMSAFDTNTFTNGRTEFGLWTTYGDYAEYNFENQDGSNVNPAVIDYIDSNYQETSINVFSKALELFDGGGYGPYSFPSPSNNNGGSGPQDSISYPYIQNVNEDLFFQGYQRYNVKAGGVAKISAYVQNKQDAIIEIYIGDDQTETGGDPSNMSLIGSITNQWPGGATVFNVFEFNVTDTQQIFFRFRAQDDTSTSVNFSNFYIDGIESSTTIANIGSPEVQGTFTDPFVVTGSIGNRYAQGVAVPPSLATKIVDAYILYSSSLSSSLDGAYVFDVVPTFGTLSITASVVVSSFTDAASALYGNAIYGTDEYGGGNAGGGTTWTTASIILYTGSANNFPNEMPELGGNVFAETSSYSLTHHTGERITLHAELNPGDLEFSDVLKMSLRVGSGSNNPSVVENSLVVTEYSMSFSSSIDSNIDPSIPTIFDNNLNFQYAYDCQPLLNNFSDNRINNRLQEVDYASGTVIPSNWQQIIDFSASRASVPESNYSKTNIINARYDGSNISSQKYNIWTPGDTGGYGKLPSIDINKVNLAYFNTLYDPYPVLNNKTIYNIQYLISDTGQVSQPKLSEISFLNIQGTFEPTPYYDNGVITYNNTSLISLTGKTSETLLPLQGESQFYQVTKRPTPILYSQKSGIFPLNKFAVDTSGEAAPEGIELVGNQPVDPNIFPNFNNYSVNAFGETEVFAETQFINDRLYLLDKDPADDGTAGPQNNTTASDANTGTSLPVWKDGNNASDGILTLPITDGNNEDTANGSPLVDTSLFFSSGFTTNFAGGDASTSPTTITIQQGTDPLTNAIVTGPTATSVTQGGVSFDITFEGDQGQNDFEITDFKCTSAGQGVGNLVGTTFTISIEAINAANTGAITGGTGNIVYVAQASDLTAGPGFAFQNEIGMGNSLSQPYELEWEFFVDMDPTDYKVRTRDHEGGWKGHSPIDEPNVGTVTVDYLKKDEYTDASFNKAKIRGVKAEILEYFSSTNASGTNFVSIPYSSIASSRVAVNQNNGQVIVTFNADTIRAAYQNAGYNDPIKQRLKVFATINQSGNSTPLVQGNQFALEYEGGFIRSTSNQGPSFFPQVSVGSYVGGQLNLQGASNSPVTAATASFWEFSGSGAGKSTKVLYCVAPSLNKAYGRGFTQKDIAYTASFNKDFPVGREPYFSTMPPIESQWELQLYDEIRFKNNEDYSYTIINITPPSENEDANLQDTEGNSALVIELDNPIPQNFENEETSTDGGRGYGLSTITSSAIPGEVVQTSVEVTYGTQRYRPLDFFLIRRFVPDAGSMVVNQKFPYATNPQKLTSAGFMVPPYTSQTLTTNPDQVLEELRNQKLIE